MIASSPSYVHLLDAEPELAARLRDDDRAEAREYLRLRVTDVPVGEWDLAADASHARPFGIMVIDGVLLQDVRLAGRSALQLLGPGDVVLSSGRVLDSLDVALRWTAPVPSRVAVLDDRLQRPFALWPGLAVGLLERTGRQLSRLAVHAAIAQLPRIDQRLEAMFWDLADRWGRVTPSGIHLPLALSHEALGRLVGGRRSTITLALGELAERGVVSRRPDRTWLLVSRRPTLPTGDPGPLAPPLTAVSAPAGDPLGGPTWRPPALAELMDTARRMREAHDDQERRLAANLARYQEAREHSQALREAVAQRRDRGVAAATARRRP
ncbi:MAG: family transcriptional regulator, cyclic receptor protein [Baekduia sp.]|nr:family transcriptional regulator, cyclic receptor protein [Baekduia sp.]